MLFAEGKESTIITVSESTYSSSSSSSGSYDTTTKTYSETNTFYSEDISHLLQKSVSSNILEDGNLEILPQNKEIAFEFVLPSNEKLFSSYKGKQANITYGVKATLDLTKRLDVNKEEHFSVFNSNNNKVVVLPSVNEENKNTVSGTGLNINLGSIFAKSRGYFHKENSEARIYLFNNNNNDAPYSPGHIVKGKVILLAQNQEKEEEKKTVREMKITLSGIEHAFAQGLQRITRIEKYEKYIELAENGGYNNDNNNTIPFEFQIPDNVNQSYTGKYSEYFWGLEAKLNIAWSSDINARTIIEIV